MNDHELDGLVATATHVRDSWVDGFDLRAAEDELMEEILATTDIPDALTSLLPPDGRSPFSGRRRRFRTAVAVGIAAALVVGVVVRSLAGDGDATDDVGTSGEPTIQPMIADQIPEGFEVERAFPQEGTDDADRSTDSRVTVYGDLEGAGITDDVVVTVDPNLSEEDLVGERATVRGGDGFVCTPAMDFCGLDNRPLTRIGWMAEPGLAIIVESRTYDRDQLLAIAEGLDVDGATVELGDVPAGADRPVPLAVLDGESGAAYSLSYVGPTETYQVFTTALDEAERIYHLWLSGPRDSVIQGRDAAVVEEYEDGWMVTWEASPGWLVQVFADTVDEASAVAFAESVRRATDAEWAELQALAAARPPDEGPAFATPPDGAAHRVLADGEQVWAWAAEDGLCFQTMQPEEEEVSYEMCGPGGGPQALGESPAWDGHNELIPDEPLVVGVAPAGTAAIDGCQLTFAEDVEAGRPYICEATGDEMPDTVTFRDPAGDEIATVEVVVH